MKTDGHERHDAQDDQDEDDVVIDRRAVCVRRTCGRGLYRFSCGSLRGVVVEELGYRQADAHGERFEPTSMCHVGVAGRATAAPIEELTLRRPQEGPVELKMASPSQARAGDFTDRRPSPTSSYHRRTAVLKSNEGAPLWLGLRRAGTVGLWFLPACRRMVDDRAEVIRRGLFVLHSANVGGCGIPSTRSEAGSNGDQRVGGTRPRPTARP